MRIQVARSWDFNQMLVASVFGHLLLMTFVLFLPTTTSLEKTITPAFMVELVEISKGDKKSAQKPDPKKKTRLEKTKPLPTTKTAKAVTPIKPIAPPKIIEPIRQSIKMPPEPKAQKVKRNSQNQILNSLNQLNNSPDRVDDELSQLSNLVPKVSLKNPVIRESKPIQETTFDEMNKLRNKKVELMPSKAEPLPVDEPPVENKTDSRLEDFEFASLSKNMAHLEKKQEEKSSADMLKELKKMEQASLTNKETVNIQKPETQVPSITKDNSRAYDSILKKLDSLDAKPKDIDTNIAVAEIAPQQFQSDIRKVTAPEKVQLDVVLSPNQAYVQSPLPGNPSADALALYKGLIIKKVMENWHAPLGQDHNKKVIISFNIFSQGNIDRPDLKLSSKVKLLDDLAMRAISESEPFPKIPESLKFSDLNITIKFKYIPKKNQT